MVGHLSIFNYVAEYAKHVYWLLRKKNIPMCAKQSLFFSLVTFAM